MPLIAVRSRSDSNGHNEVLNFLSPFPFHSLVRLAEIWHRNTMNDTLKRITVDPAICHGKPTVRGLRYPVSMILELLAGNMTPEEILADYPDLEREDISACLAFAARLSSVPRILPLAA